MKNKIYSLLLLLCCCIKFVLAQSNTDFGNQNNQFGIRLYQSLIQETSKDNNLVFSPLCLSSALAMSYWGAQNSTAKQFEQLLNLQNKNSFQQQYAKFLSSLHQDEVGNQLKIANAIWLDKSFSIQQTYQDILTNTFDNKAKIVDFQNNAEGATQQINDWMKAQTQEKITEIIPPRSLPANTRFIITNALYFNAHWQSVFEENVTRDDVFFTSSGKEVKTAFMSQKSDFFYMEDEKFVSVVLLFKGLQYMTFIMPKPSYSLEDLEKSITPEFYKAKFGFTSDDLLAEKTSFKSGEMILHLPRFKMDIALSMIPALERLGLKHAFDIEQKADFSGISPDNNLVISDILHKTYLNVNETGVEAASATAVIFVGRGGGKVIELKLNRPFLFYIGDGDSGSILFQGRLVNPEK